MTAEVGVRPSPEPPEEPEAQQQRLEREAVDYFSRFDEVATLGRALQHARFYQLLDLGFQADSFKVRRSQDLAAHRHLAAEEALGATRIGSVGMSIHRDLTSENVLVDAQSSVSAPQPAVLSPPATTSDGSPLMAGRGAVLNRLVQVYWLVLCCLGVLLGAVLALSFERGTFVLAPVEAVFAASLWLTLIATTFRLGGPASESVRHGRAGDQASAAGSAARAEH